MADIFLALSDNDDFTIADPEVITNRQQTENCVNQSTDNKNTQFNIDRVQTRMQNRKFVKSQQFNNRQSTDKNAKPIVFEKPTALQEAEYRQQKTNSLWKVKSFATDSVQAMQSQQFLKSQHV